MGIPASQMLAVTRYVVKQRLMLPERGPRAPLAKPESIEQFRRMLAAPLSDADLRRLGIG